MAAKTTVSLPDELHEWAKNQPDLNVSEVLRNALSAEQELRNKLQSDDLAEALIHRLKDGGGKEPHERHPEFYSSGRRYAAKSLSQDELEDITAWYQDESAFVAEQDAWTLLRRLADLTDEFHGDPMAMHRQHLDKLLESKRFSAPRLEAFVRGIVDLWIEAIPKLDD